MTPPSPETETTVSRTVHVASVSLTVKSKYSLIIQKPASLTCEAIKLPEPIAITINAGSTPVPAINPLTRPAAVNAATVAEPRETLSSAAINLPKKSGYNEDDSNIFEITFATPPSTSTCLNAPPPPIINSNIAICLTATSRDDIISLTGILRANPIE